MKQALKILALLFVLLIFCYALVAFFLPLKLPTTPESSVLSDIHGVEIGEIIYSGSIRHRELAYGDIPRFYIEALVALEDKTFWSHPGLSGRGILRSLMRNIESGRVVEGASTITTQLIRNAFWINEKRDFKHKFLESVYALRIEHIHTKEEILTEYINRVSFGHLNI
jgi:membrane peptidoglycan carboxypeptidase